MRQAPQFRRLCGIAPASVGNPVDICGRTEFAPADQRFALSTESGAAAVAVAGGMLIFGGELNDFARRLMYVVLVAGILLGASQIVALFGSTGASIGVSDERAGEGA